MSRGDVAHSFFRLGAYGYSCAALCAWGEWWSSALVSFRWKKNVLSIGVEPVLFIFCCFSGDCSFRNSDAGFMLSDRFYCLWACGWGRGITGPFWVGGALEGLLAASLLGEEDVGVSGQCPVECRDIKLPTLKKKEEKKLCLADTRTQTCHKLPLQTGAQVQIQCKSHSVCRRSLLPATKTNSQPCNARESLVMVPSLCRNIETHSCIKAIRIYLKPNKSKIFTQYLKSYKWPFHISVTDWKQK